MQYVPARSIQRNIARSALRFELLRLRFALEFTRYETLLIYEAINNNSTATDRPNSPSYLQLLLADHEFGNVFGAVPHVRVRLLTLDYLSAFVVTRGQGMGLSANQLLLELSTA